MDDRPKISQADPDVNPLATMSVRTQARILGVSASTVVRDRQRVDKDGRAVVWKARGIDGKVRPSRRLDNRERDALIVQRRQAGDSLRTIALAADCSVGTVHRVLKTADDIR